MQAAQNRCMHSNTTEVFFMYPRHIGQETSAFRRLARIVMLSASIWGSGEQFASYIVNPGISTSSRIVLSLAILPFFNC